ELGHERLKLPRIREGSEEAEEEGALRRPRGTDEERVNPGEGRERDALDGILTLAEDSAEGIARCPEPGAHGPEIDRSILCLGHCFHSSPSVLEGPKAVRDASPGVLQSETCCVGCGLASLGTRGRGALRAPGDISPSPGSRTRRPCHPRSALETS